MQTAMIARTSIIGIATLFLATGTAHTAQPLWLPSAQYEKPTFDKEMLPKPPSHFPLLPPSKYDRPYVGRLTLEISADPNCLGNAIACAQGGQFSCQIKMMPDEVIISRGFDPLDVFRHEQGHCNGWMGDHRDSDPEW